MSLIGEYGHGAYVCWDIFQLLVMERTLNLFGWKLMSHSLSHCLSFLRSSCSFVVFCCHYEEVETKDR